MSTFLKKIGIIIVIIGIILLTLLPEITNQIEKTRTETLKGKITKIHSTEKNTILTIDAKCEKKVLLYKQNNTTLKENQTIKIKGEQAKEIFYAELVEE